MLRLKGWMLMRQGRGEEAEAQLRASIDWARQQQAKSWELRSSTTLARTVGRARPARRRARAARADLQLVHRRLRHARSQGGPYATGVPALRDTIRET